jgi:hypothetical protein
MVGSSWLLGERLSGGAEITYHGRRGYHLRVTRGDGALPGGPAMFYPLDAIVDEETGCLLRLIAYDGDAPATWWELNDVTAEPGGTADPAGFRPRIPPGTRVLEESGNPLVDSTAVMPGLTGTAVRAAAETIVRTTGAVSAARTFLDNLRGRSQPPRPPAEPRPSRLRIRIRTTEPSVTHPRPHSAPSNDINAPSMLLKRHRCPIDVVIHTARHTLAVRRHTTGTTRPGFGCSPSKPLP